MKFYAQVESGKMTMHDKEGFHDYLNSLKGLVRIDIRKAEKIRSLPQNKLYWKIVTIAADYCGLTKMEMHETFKSEYLVEIRVADNRGRKIFLRVPRSTTELTTKEFKDYLDDIYRWAAEFNIILPDPDQL